jgi:hypothetical protein
MEIIEQPDGQSCLLRLSREEWVELGDDYGYLTSERLQQFVPSDDPPIGPRCSMDARMRVRMTAESDGTFGIYIRRADGEDGKPAPEELLCKLTSYRDALAVQLLIREMAEKIADDRERRAAVARSLMGKGMRVENDGQTRRPPLINGVW